MIRVGVNTIAFVSENSSKFMDFNEKTGEYENRFRVADTSELARDVVRALNKEQEDGTTPVHLLLDDAIEEAFEQGSLGFHDSDEEQSG